ncbi:type 2 isopentenyl-diphosphate Delta-isomerase [Caldalkalibacillus salinus]|uniref:type 2 isopentenyl-diphosphate Delta-isomerase n=1 Tax=Caldalkalibacillus salinus TaxID=2803787 RepID=UPI0019233DC3|nr:type 2 isopentenyl-diphosphate Delta-isomerase [Caldalkalibacillus salinus]
MGNEEHQHLAQTEQRKNEHIDIVLHEDVSGEGMTTGLEKYTLIHNALPEVSFEDISLATTFLDKQVKTPFLISSMTGGTQRAWEINRTLAQVAEKRGWAMGLGSVRAAIENKEVRYSFKLRSVAPTIPIIANMGAVQLNYGYGVEECLTAVKVTHADALVLHLNTMQEVFQPEGDLNFSHLLPKIENVVRQVDVPVGVKEVGWGINADVASRLKEIGIAFIDVAGAGGTSWSQVEKYRATSPVMKEVAQTFASWGNPTAECITDIHQEHPHLPIIASGGIRNGLEAAKCLALGAQTVGYGRSILRDASVSVEALEQRLQKIELECRIAMFGVGVSSIVELQKGTSIKKV